MDASPQENKLRAIPAEACNIDTSLDDLSEVLASLNQRLAPAMTSEPPDSETRAVEDVPSELAGKLLNLAGKLLNSRRRVEAFTRDLRSILERLEL